MKEMNELLREQQQKELERKLEEKTGLRNGDEVVYVPHSWHPAEPTTILSKAIEQIEQMGNYKVMVALADLDKSKPKEERLYTFTDIESKKLREVIYKEIEKEM